jgi:predicted NAD/FAD-binding protein
MEALEAGLTDRVRAILQEDADALNRPFREYSLYPLYAEGWHTPLAFAVKLGQTEAVRLLLNHGADRTVRSPERRTLYDIAVEAGHQDIADLLKERPIGE